MDSETKDSASFTGLLQSASKLVVWVGASAGAISLILSVFGYLVEHAYLDQLGVPRTYYEAQPAEYITAGGKFLMGVIQLAAVGAPQFVLRYWWFAVVVIAASAAAWRWRWRAEWRWLCAAAFLAVWLLIALPRFEASLSPPEANALVAAFTAVTVGGIVYAYAELSMDGPPGDKATAVSLRRRYGPRVPFLVLLLSAILALPYLRGAYATKRTPASIEFIGKDRAYFCELAGEASPDVCAQETWQLIEVGKDRAILRHTKDQKLYIVPAGMLTTFRIVGKEPKQ
jgi:hypothetical protein